MGTTLSDKRRRWRAIAPAKDHALASQWLRVTESTIEGAGQGVKTEVDIPKGVKVLEYTGIWRRQKKTDSDHVHGHHRYCFEYNRHWCIDATSKVRGGQARYVNDVFGTRRRTNLRWMVCRKVQKVFLVSTRKIKRKSELFVRYGSEYWLGREEAT